MPIAAIIGKENNDVSGQIVEMLDVMKNNKRVFNVATCNEFATSEDVSSPNLTEAKMAIGNSRFHYEEGGPTSPLSMDRTSGVVLALSGHINNTGTRAGCRTHNRRLLANLIEGKMRIVKDLSKAVQLVLPTLYGVFSVIVMMGGRIAVTKDVFGFEPLYWGENERYIAFASERKALWTIGLRDLNFPPGHVAMIDGQGSKTFFKVMALKRPQIVDINVRDAANKLCEMLKKILLRDFRETKEVGLLFSGGIDSSLLAKISRDAGIPVTLYGAAVEEAHDVAVIKDSASDLGCKLRMRILSTDEIEGYVYKTIWTVEEGNLMQVGVGLPIYAALEVAKSDGLRCVFSGQGADELFGGYSRYRRIIQDGHERLYDEMWNDVATIAEGNLQRDYAIAMANNVNYYSPFLNLEVVNLAMSLPAILKVNGPEDMLRKHVLREAGRKVNLPDNIVYRPKKAAQYSSGAYKAIRRLASREGKRPREYIKYVYEKIFRQYHGSKGELLNLRST